MLYAIDKIENNIVMAENLKTGEKKQLKIEDFPFQIYEGCLFSIKENHIIKESEKEKLRILKLREKMERLKRHE